MLYRCPEGELWELPLELAIGKYGIHSGVACPRHRLYAKRAGNG